MALLESSGQRFVGALAAAALVLAMLPACGGSSPASSSGSSGKIDTVRFGMTSNVAGFWPIFIAESRGFFTEERIKLDTVVAQTSSRETEALLSNSVDVVSGTPDNMLLADTQGRSVHAIAALRNAPAASLVVSPSIQGFGDLKGKRIAVSEVTGSDAYFVRSMLKANGVDPSQVQLVASGGTPNRAAALQSGAVSAALLDQPQDIQLMQKGLKRLGVTLDYVKDYAWSWLSVEQGHAKTVSDELVRFLRALQKAVDWFYDSRNREAAAALLSQRLSVPADVASATYDLYVKYRSLAPDLKPSSQGVARLEEAMSEGNVFKGATPPDPSRFIDLSYLQKARGRG
jgi:NitT/TauT family transport system substrate-binding protein